YLTIYSTFLQRAYDQVIHDVALQNLPVVFCIDRAGIVGTDGATHHGYFDISFLRSIPNMIVSAPMNAQDFQNLLYTAQFTEQPFTIRFPKGNSEAGELNLNFEKVEIGKAIELKSASTPLSNQKIAILTFGTIGQKIQNVILSLSKNLKEKYGHYKFIFCKPLDYNSLDGIFENYSTILIFEDGILNGGFGDAVLEYANDKNFKGKIFRKGYPDEFLPHASIEELEKEIGLDEDSILKFLLELN